MLLLDSGNIAAHSTNTYIPLDTTMVPRKLGEDYFVPFHLLAHKGLSDN